MRFESPKVRTEPAEADLHFVRNAYTAGGANVMICLSQIFRREDDLAADTGKSFRDECRTATARLQSLADFADVVRVLYAGLRIASPVNTTIVIRQRRNVNPRLFASAARAIEFIRADIDQRGGVPVICMLEHDYIFAARVGAREAQRKLIGFAAGVHEIAHPQRTRHKRRELLRITQNVFVKVARIRIQERELFLHRVNNTRVRMAHQRHVIVDIEKRAARFVVEVLPPAADDF